MTQPIIKLIPISMRPILDSDRLVNGENMTIYLWKRVNNVNRFDLKSYVYLLAILRVRFGYLFGKIWNVRIQ